MTGTKTQTLTDFLLARIGEDDNMARQAGHGCGYVHEHNAGWVEIELPDEHNCRPSYEARFIRNMSPQRVLAECDAKRQLIERVGNPNWAGFSILALPYADHPDYRDEWRP